MTARRWTALALLAMAGIFAVSSIPGPGAAGDRFVLVPPGLQNLLHVPVFGILAWLWWRSLAARGMAPRLALAAAAAIAVAYGVLDEVHQTFVPGRYGSLADALLDGLGALAAVAWVAWRRRPARRSLADQRPGGGAAGPT
jgi:hypothetical protein